MDVNLTCVRLSVDDLLKCSFGLTSAEVRILLRMLKKPGWTTVSDIARAAGKDRSVVQRSLSSMVKKQMVERDQKNKEHGGFEFLYRPKDKKAIKKAILENSRTFYNMVQGTVKSW
jgi:predicted transcriptional regulator